MSRTTIHKLASDAKKKQIAREGRVVEIYARQIKAERMIADNIERKITCVVLKNNNNIKKAITGTTDRRINRSKNLLFLFIRKHTITAANNNKYTLRSMNSQ
jgi:hypothetical protein